MEPSEPRHLKIGDTLDGIVIKAMGGRRFALRCSAAPKSWAVELHARHSDGISEGDQVSAWVAKISPLHGEVLVHDGDFGRLPISEAMSGRYREGMLALLGRVDATGENLAEARGMIVRIQKQQQADWLTVWKLLGEPAPVDVKIMLQKIDAMRTARKEAPDTMPELVEDMKSSFGVVFERALKKLG